MATKTRARLTGLLSAALVAALFAVQPALANHESPTNGPDHNSGDMVSYPLVFPVVGENSYGNSFYSKRGNGIHHATDIMAPKMTPVVASASGTVLWIGSTCCTVQIRHDDGWRTKYYHLNNDTPGTDDGQGWGLAPGIVLGAEVHAGQLIGWVGDSGNAESTPPHLHFELVDPHDTIVNSYEALRAAEWVPLPAACESLDAGDLAQLLEDSVLLREGDVGVAVSQLQQFLTIVGFAVGSVDGIFGLKTNDAVRQFQEDWDLEPDGVVGPNTVGIIEDVNYALPVAAVLDADGRVMRPGARGEDVQQLQDLLDIAGFHPGPTDGVYGAQTEAAVYALQEAIGGLNVDGKVGVDTREALANLLGVAGLEFCS